MKILHLVVFLAAVSLFLIINPLGISLPSDIDEAGSGLFSFIGLTFRFYNPL
ncbi:hypothetical protein J2T58_002161 [Methanocalculus alkaliphilus]|uniref:hypothetical protein n=1 Tax=Methanocalculus alkaliphilus TaxID=768730 RepID=UPI0020A04EA8|nr:hypothetical protein [Methanocalculus alkaliphilus]MCP1716285.1 hypothetical protein [Methanocalculus alkaliphilus]